jgi:hypothetical protein
VKCMNEMRTSLIKNGKCTEALDEMPLKIICSKQKKLHGNNHLHKLHKHL